MWYSIIQRVQHAGKVRHDVAPQALILAARKDSASIRFAVSHTANFYYVVQRVRDNYLYELPTCFRAQTIRVGYRQKMLQCLDM